MQNFVTIFPFHCSPPPPSLEVMRIRVKPNRNLDHAKPFLRIHINNLSKLSFAPHGVKKLNYFWNVSQVTVASTDKRTDQRFYRDLSSTILMTDHASMTAHAPVRVPSSVLSSERFSWDRLFQVFPRNLSGDVISIFFYSSENRDRIRFRQKPLNFGFDGVSSVLVAEYALLHCS